ncbi:hypothetical protein H8957_016737, partial [Semnopithecus entellus]
HTHTLTTHHTHSLTHTLHTSHTHSFTLTHSHRLTQSFPHTDTHTHTCSQDRAHLMGPGGLQVGGGPGWVSLREGCTSQLWPAAGEDKDCGRSSSLSGGPGLDGRAVPPIPLGSRLISPLFSCLCFPLGWHCQAWDTGAPEPRPGGAPCRCGTPCQGRDWVALPEDPTP